jgi:hypothetical protein
VVIVSEDGDPKWILTEDMEEAAIFADLRNNQEAYTGYNGIFESFMV